MIEETKELFDSMDWILEDHERLQYEVEELRKFDTRYIPLAVVVVILSYLYGITFGVYMCPK